jgi:lycopene beta-cyclase
LVYKSKEPVFNPDQATFMDFSVEQKAPLYVCAANFNHRSFIRIYIFTPAFDKEEYEQEIKQYIENLGIQNFEIIERKGSIPMTCYPSGTKLPSVLNIGTWRVD